MDKTVKCFFMIFVLLTIILINFNFSIAEAIDSDNDGWPDQYEEKLSADPKDSNRWLRCIICLFFLFKQKKEADMHKDQLQNINPNHVHGCHP